MTISLFFLFFVSCLNGSTLPVEIGYIKPRPFSSSRVCLVKPSGEITLNDLSVGEAKFVSQFTLDDELFDRLTGGYFFTESQLFCLLVKESNEMDRDNFSVNNRRLFLLKKGEKTLEPTSICFSINGDWAITPVLEDKVFIKFTGETGVENFVFSPASNKIVGNFYYENFKDSFFSKNTPSGTILFGHSHSGYLDEINPVTNKVVGRKWFNSLREKTFEKKYTFIKDMKGDFALVQWQDHGQKLTKFWVVNANDMEIAAESENLPLFLGSAFIQLNSQRKPVAINLIPASTINSRSISELDGVVIKMNISDGEFSKNEEKRFDVKKQVPLLDPVSGVVTFFPNENTGANNIIPPDSSAE